MIEASSSDMAGAAQLLWQRTLARKTQIEYDA